jgi:hypothetical protein
MRIFGSIKELVAAVFRKDSVEITVRPNQSTTYTVARDIQLPPINADEIVVGEAAQQTLTNKTLTAPVISSISNTGTLTLPTSTDTLIGRITTDTGANRLKNKDLEDSTVIIVDASDTSKQIKFDAGGTASTATTIAAAQTSNRTVTLPNATTTLVGTDVAQVITAKDIDGGTASDTSRITVPKAATATLSGLTRKQGTIVYDTTENKLKVDDGTNLNTVGSGGSGEINYISNFDFESGATTGWATYDDGASATPVNGTGGSPSTLTLSANSTTPLRGNFDLKVAKSAADSQGEGFSYDFTIKAPDVSKKLKIQFDLNSTDADYTAGDVRIYVYDVTNAALITPSNTSLPKMTGTHQITFDSTTSTSYRLIFHWSVTTATAVDLYLDNIVVGPGVVVQGAAVGEWLSYTPTVANLSTSSTAGKWRRVGDTMEVEAYAVASGAASGIITFEVPSGYTIDTTKLAAGGANQVLGVAYLNESGGNLFAGVASYAASTTIRMSSQNQADYWNNTNPIGGAIQSGDKFSVHFSVPISAWAGSGTVNLAQNDVEYASNSSTSTAASDTTSFAYGPAGNLIQSITAELSRRVRFQTPIQSSDKLFIEMSPDGRSWTPAGGLLAGQTVESIRYDGTNNIGIGINALTTPATDVDVFFGKYRNGTTTSWAAVASYYWRVRKVAAGAAVGFGIVQSGSAGLVPAQQSNLDDVTATRLGFKTYVHGGSYNGGAAPTVTLTGGGGSLSSVVRAAFVPYQLQDGAWRCRMNLNLSVSSAVRTSATFSVVSLTAKNVASYYQNVAVSDTSNVAMNGYVTANATTITCVHASATTTLYVIAGDIELESKPSWAY